MAVEELLLPSGEPLWSRVAAESASGPYHCGVGLVQQVRDDQRLAGPVQEHDLPCPVVVHDGDLEDRLEQPPRGRPLLVLAWRRRSLAVAHGCSEHGLAVRPRREHPVEAEVSPLPRQGRHLPGGPPAEEERLGESLLVGLQREVVLRAGGQHRPHRQQVALGKSLQNHVHGGVGPLDGRVDQAAPPRQPDEGHVAEPAERLRGLPGGGQLLGVDRVAPRADAAAHHAGGLREGEVPGQLVLPGAQHDLVGEGVLPDVHEPGAGLVDVWGYAVHAPAGGGVQVCLRLGPLGRRQLGSGAAEGKCRLDVGQEGGRVQGNGEEGVGDLDGGLGARGGRRRHAVGQGDHVVALLAGLAHGGLDAAVGHEACERYGLDAMGLELRVQRRAWKCAQAPLADDDDVSRLGLHRIADRSVPRSPREELLAVAAREDAEVPVRVVGPVFRKADGSVEDLDAQSSHLLRQLRGLGEHTGCGHHFPDLCV
mmetsp:Transcript_40083/g.115618  ORF Transcript_40083/g.115618 Transcript_40083/m.115618 type:complete len:480 (-) Transcript_40083:205-1644(-)